MTIWSHVSRRGLVFVPCMLSLAMPRAVAGQGQDCSRDGLDAASFKRVIRQSFSGLLGSSSGGVPGSYASLDIKDAAATFASTTMRERGPAIGVKVSGGVSDGVVAAISDQSVSPTFGAEVQLHFLSRQPQSVQFDNQSCRAYYAAVAKAEATHRLREVDIRGHATRIQQQGAAAALAGKLAVAREALGTATVEHARDSITVEIARLVELQEQARAQPLPDEGAERMDSDLQRAQELIAAREKLQIEGFHIGWWSVTYGLSNAKFRLYDPAAAFDKQVSVGAYVSQSMGIMYSRYASTRITNESHFWSVGAQMASDNNIGDLKKVDLNDRTTNGSGSTERISEKKYTVYTGAYKENLKSLRVSADYYRFILLDNEGALHFAPAVTARDESRPAYSLGLGFLLTARKEPKKESAINAELFYTLTDLTDSQETKKKFWGRSDLGLRFTVPVSFTPGS